MEYLIHQFNFIMVKFSYSYIVAAICRPKEGSLQRDHVVQNVTALFRILFQGEHSDTVLFQSQKKISEYLSMNTESLQQSSRHHITVRVFTV